ncbi:MAG TPA: O-antigen ligase family protein [Solirubrobacteraceae bacterium]|jgi:tetratricopeptide (TPR) repeat protein
MRSKLTGALREAPVTVPALAALTLFVIWATDQAGYPVTHWGPGGLIVLALVVLSVGLMGLRPATAPPAVRVAVACLAGYTALSYLSILWASVPGDAWEGANRTLLYLLVFVLFAAWPQRGETAALMVVLWTLALTGLAAYTALHLDSASAGALRGLMPDGRLVDPTGYPNANAAQWLIAAWPAVLLARSERLHWALRGLLAASAVTLAGVALLSQSRGSLYATPVMLALVFALLPGRLRTFAVLVPVAAGIAAAAPAVLRVGNHLRDGAVVPATLHNAVTTIFLAAVAVGLAVALGAALESRLVLSPGSAGRLRKALGAAAIGTLLVVVAGGLAAAGNPVTRIRHTWNSFKGGYATRTTGSRLVSGLGSNRYDFYRVALDEFAAHPVAGIGADNFQQQYLAKGQSSETPHYPHSVELRVLAQTGLVGALLAVAGLAAALLAAGLSLRRADPLARAVAAAALGGFAYWLVHGSFDWFWEFAGLGAPAFALLGLACSLAPRGTVDAGEPARGGVMQGRRTRLALLLTGSLTALAAAASLAAPWLSRLEVQDAAHIWTHARAAAYNRLDEAAGLNPLSDEAYLVAGSIALRYGELARADHQFRLALGRTPGDAYATLERGAIASTRGDRASADRLLARAARLNPRDSLTREALRLSRAGERVSVAELNRLILLKAHELG